MTIKVVSANFYVGNRQPKQDARFIKSFDCDVIGVQEGHSGNMGTIREVVKDKYRLYVGSKGFGAQDVPVYAKRNLNVLSFRSIQVSKRAEVKNIGMPRNAGVLRFKKDGATYCFINTHLNAAVQNRASGRLLPRKIKRVYEFVRSMQKLNKVMKRAQKRGEHIVLVGDLNYRNIPKVIHHRWSPPAVFKRRRLNWRAQGLDWIVWSKDLALKEFEVIPVSKHGGDHPWIIASFYPKKRKA